VYKITITEEHIDFIGRRIQPFITRWSFRRNPFITILQNIYIQGMSDAMEALELTNDKV